MRTTGNVCAGCGLPPGPSKSLLRCTRCRSVYYHDQRCQRAHFRIHRRSCRPPTRSSSKEAGGNDPISPALNLDVVPMEGKGKGVRSGARIPPGMLVASFDPLVAPVITPLELRQTHCALCLQPISRPTVVSANPKYYVAICSDSCVSSLSTELIPKWLKDETETINKALASFYPPNSPVVVLPTAILIYRIVRSALPSINEMKTHHRRLSEDAALHQQAITTFVQQLFLVSDPSKLPSPEKIALILSAIKYNSFTITRGDGLDAVGVALYKAPSYRINHSCAPNTRQSFQGTKLLLHAAEPIEKGDEICIQYCDLKDPRERKQFLKEEYCFSCCCRVCSQDDD